MKSIRVTQIKSGINRNETAKRTLVALGLRKMNASRDVVATPQILGMVKRVGHLIKVEDIETIEPVVAKAPVEEKKSAAPAPVEKVEAVQPVAESTEEVSPEL